MPIAELIELLTEQLPIENREIDAGIHTIVTRYSRQDGKSRFLPGMIANPANSRVGSARPRDQRA
jgi:hypothetical protein